MTEYFQLWSPENYQAARPPAVADPAAALSELGI